MCHGPTAEPAVFGPGWTAATGAHFELEAADGARSLAFQARPRSSSGVGVVVLPDTRGLHRFYERLALSLAREGHPTVAIDWYGRTAGTAKRGDDFAFMAHLSKLRRETIDADIAAAIDHVKTGEGVTSVFTVGFCFGGRQAFFAAAPQFGLAGTVGFYGAPGVFPNGAPGPTQRASELRAPMLGLFGGADPGIPSSDVDAFDAALTDAGISHELITYPGLPHGFFDLHLAEYHDAAVDAWRRVLAFLRQGHQVADRSR